MAIKKEYIKNVSEYLQKVDLLHMMYCDAEVDSELLFRGQNSALPLIPKLGRLNLRKKNDSLKTTEKKILTEFKRGIVPLSEFRPENNWDLLALAQHHGLPTRLLDWSSNALIGLWFTVCHPPLTSNNYLKDGVIWVFAPTKDDYRTDTTKAEPLNNGLTKVFKSSVITRRISAQSGVFTLHKIMKEDRFINFESNSSFKKKLFPIYVKGEDFAYLRKELNILGINNSSVFPDIDGYSRHIGWKYFKMQDERL